ncbi:UDP-N-acetylmuramoyl-L-alanyl-D-glutamate--2,6-diaminopimelate ligase [Rhodococcus sp. 14-2470-1b]|uniref:UDP-N-acetylmuramoyl-L-alanyl-D-glutamate--2, 6-diaminopimelate ligase n=1 Tax=Rhodococcus sp. 14-2470-1b TaxID=2023149 RepID=UPI000B9BADB1|nr:UDP-N-acetylmuramoyl-L-alanyl-D-glutamate--2,6-diaminopimelate ligase [Rhodococcus sp. 14-2470-1b]OZF45576.1 UDP-N-acetylmuramoyl-L-alanyl-D-glutamate--2,6-diaminopimelate ligase [Rhodococcus sp. 14-2470-1b]
MSVPAESTDAPSSLRPSNPPRTAVEDIAAAAEARLVHAAMADGSELQSPFVTGVDLRAQGVVTGDLFAALPGSAAHGASFVATAIDRGAAAILTDSEGLELVSAQYPQLPVPVLVRDRPREVLGHVSALVYGNPSEKMTVIGITGTSGKTTTSYLLEAALSAAGRRTGLIGTIETKIAGTRVPSALTTPEAPHLHALFAAMVEQGLDTVVMEVSSHALSLGRVDGTVFSVGAFTNLSQDHLDFHDTLEEYFLAKSRLFAAESRVHTRSAAVCIDDAWGQRMADIARSAGSTLLTVSVLGDADWTVDGWSKEPTGTQRFTLVDTAGNRHAASIRLPGRYNVANAALATAVCAAAGVDVRRAVAGMADVDVPGRVQRISRGQKFLAVVDYAHKPAAVEAVIETLREQTQGRIAVVLGAGGDRDTAKRPLMGAAGARGADLLVITDDNPRSEDPALIRDAVMAGALSVDESSRGEVRNVAGRGAAIADAVNWAREGDVVLIAGKGHETGQEIDGVKYPFDDRVVLADALDRATDEHAGASS